MCVCFLCFGCMCLLCMCSHVCVCVCVWLLSHTITEFRTSEHLVVLIIRIRKRSPERLRLAGSHSSRGPQDPWVPMSSGPKSRRSGGRQPPLHPRCVTARHLACPSRPRGRKPSWERWLGRCPRAQGGSGAPLRAGAGRRGYREGHANHSALFFCAY